MNNIIISFCEWMYERKEKLRQGRKGGRLSGEALFFFCEWVKERKVVSELLFPTLITGSFYIHWKKEKTHCWSILKKEGKSSSFLPSFYFV